jgi:hypothetical protein
VNPVMALCRLEFQRHPANGDVRRVDRDGDDGGGGHRKLGKSSRVSHSANEKWAFDTEVLDTRGDPSPSECGETTAVARRPAHHVTSANPKEPEHD